MKVDRYLCRRNAVGEDSPFGRTDFPLELPRFVQLPLLEQIIQFEDHAGEEVGDAGDDAMGTDGQSTAGSDKNMSKRAQNNQLGEALHEIIRRTTQDDESRVLVNIACHFTYVVICLHFGGNRCEPLTLGRL